MITGAFGQLGGLFKFYSQKNGFVGLFTVIVMFKLQTQALQIDIWSVL